MEVCGGQTHTLVRSGIDRLVPDGLRLVHGPGCPVCVTPLEQIDRALAIAARPGVIFTSFGDMLRVPGSSTRPAPRAGRGGRRAGRLLAAGCRADRAGEPRAGGRLLRRRLRDHRARHGPGGPRGAAAGPGELLDAGLARPRPAGDGGHPRVADQPRAGLPRRRARLHRDGVRGIPGPRRALPRPDRRHGVRAGRPARGHPDGRPPARGGPVRGREPVRPLGPSRREPPGAGDHRRGLRGLRPPLARPGRAAAERPAADGGLPRPRRRGDGSRSPRSGPSSRPSAAAARCCKGSSTPETARRSARSAPPTTPSGPPWSRARGRARPTGSTAGAPARRRSNPSRFPGHDDGLEGSVPDEPGPLLSRAPAARGPRPPGPRGGGGADAPPDPRGPARGLRQRVPAADGRRGGAAGDRGPRGPDDRQLCREPARLPRRGHRQAGRVRDDQRPGRLRGRAPVPEPRPHRRGGPADRDAEADRRQRPRRGAARAGCRW